MHFEEDNLLIYTHTVSPRLRYIAGFIGNEIIGKAFDLTDEIEVFRSHNGPKINYGDGRLDSQELWLKPHRLLFEDGISPQSISCFGVGGYKAFFKTEGDHPFDIFAAAFYLLSRYEEYLPHNKDIYGRYAHENSLAFKEGFLQEPLVNKWLKQFAAKLEQLFTNSTFYRSLAGKKVQGFRFLPTYDIDEAYSYKYKGLLRSLGAAGKAVLKGHWSRVAERVRVVKGDLKDPYDSYDWMNQLHREYDLEPGYFFLVADQIGKYDRNILPVKKPMEQLIRNHSEKYRVGVHPSWQSGDDPSLIRREIQTIEQITGKSVRLSRQHFIRFTLPQTFRHLLQAGINEDFSMGYGSINGFRASVASAFYWYDLEREQATELLLYPFCFMDANSFFEQKDSPEQALAEMRQYCKEVKDVDGILITLWHNTFLGTDSLFKGWREAYAQFISGI